MSRWFARQELKLRSNVFDGDLPVSAELLRNYYIL